MTGWLSCTRVVHRSTGARGTVQGSVTPLLLYDRPQILWDHGAVSVVDGWRLQRSPDDWFARAVKAGR